MSVLKDFVSSMKSASRDKTSPYDTTATVTRIEGSTAWVHIPGGVDETPVKLTIDAKKGDSVQVRISGGKAWITGNSTAPPTDDKVAVDAKKLAITATEKAESAQSDIDEEMEYFWHDKLGAHVLGSKSGYRNDIKSDGMHVTEVESGGEVAYFGTNAVIGKADGSQNYLYEDYHSLQLKDKEGNTYFHISDLRDADGYLTECFEGDGSTVDFEVANSIDASGTITVTVDGTEQTSGTDYTLSDTTFTFTTAPSSGDEIVIYYLPTTTRTKCYTLGTRKSTDTDQLGLYSVAEGYDITADGDYSHAEGYGTWAASPYTHAEGRKAEAGGYYSHAEGDETQAGGLASHAEGRYTEASGSVSHAEGRGSKASGYYSHAEGYGTLATATGEASHAEGRNTIASSGYGSHAEGNSTTASGVASHAEGNSTTASGVASHAEGSDTTASGYRSHAQNWGTIAASAEQTALGKHNVSDSADTYALIIGNGTSDSARSNALTVDWNGQICVQGYPLITTEVVSLDNQSIAAGDPDTITYSCTKTGYTPVGIIGFDIDNASSSGGYASYINVYACRLSGTTITWQVRNLHSSSAAVIKLNAYVLYVAAGQGIS